MYTLESVGQLIVGGMLSSTRMRKEQESVFPDASTAYMVTFMDPEISVPGIGDWVITGTPQLSELLTIEV